MSYSRFTLLVTFDPHLHILRSWQNIAIGCVEMAIPNIVGIALGMALLSSSVHELYAIYAFGDL